MKIRIFEAEYYLKKHDILGKWNGRTNFQVKYLGLDHRSKQYVRWNDPRCSGGARASGRANISAAAAIVTTYDMQKPEATADRAIYSR